VNSQPVTFAAIVATGPLPATDRVLEAAAVRVRDGAVEARFCELANPGELPPAAVELTGLKPRDVAGRPKPAAVLSRLLDFCGSGRLVVGDRDAFAAFLEAEGFQAPACLDLAEMGHIARPAATDFSPEGLAGALSMEAGDARRAAGRADLVRRLWAGLLDLLSSCPPAALDAVCRIAEGAGHPLAPVLAEAGAARGGFELASEAEQALLGLFADQSKLLRRAQRNERAEPQDEPLPTDAIARMFAPDGAVGRHLPDYEQRAEQVEMLEAVCEALSEPHHLVVEAGTGTGKSLAYLLPAIAWACTNGDKVVVSTNTHNLQEQLYRKDLPFLTALVPGRFEAALLKGRRNYLCVRRFLHLLRYFERELADPEEQMALAPLVVWAAGTQSGDLAECNGFLLGPAAPAVIQAVTTGPDECAGRACRLRTRCFVNRARACAQLADLIVVNHALLFAELDLDSPVLPPYRCVIFDEAHNLEDVATDALAAVVDGPAVFRITNFLYRRRRDGSGSGLLATAMHVAGGVPGTAALTAAIGAAMDAVDDVVQAARQFLEMLAEPYADLPAGVERVLLSECRPELGPGSPAWQAAERMHSAARSLGQQVEEAAHGIEALEGEEAADVARDLRAQMVRLGQVCEAAESILAQEDESCVYWLGRTARGRATLCSIHAAPLHVGQDIRKFFFEDKRCVVMTSATLQVDDSFDYTVERLGADELPPGRLKCLAVGSPFDYDRQALVGVTTFLPDPGGSRDKMFDDELSSFLVDLFHGTRGRALVLFTSYSLLDAVYERIKGPLAGAGITVLAQGHSGGREAITSLFRTLRASVLLGTRSFWEGVDIPGEALTCLVLTKLPFHVFTDPLVRGRTEHLRALGRDPFLHYTLPEAVIGFRQGFGRLIRTRRDTGVVIVTDRRMVTKGYGRSFLRSLPTRHRVLRTRQEALEAVRAFFDRQGA
jgi:Rad3-related DNA helicase